MSFFIHHSNMNLSKLILIVLFDVISLGISNLGVRLYLIVIPLAHWGFGLFVLFFLSIVLSVFPFWIHFVGFHVAFFVRF